jgi:shikimate dehydrogenase
LTDRYAVVGHPIGHSLSPRIHAEFARQTGQDMCYEAILAPLDGFAACVDAFRAAGGKGMNVTVPFKLEACRYASRLTARARLAQAVNTLAFDGGDVLGDNTDGAGLVRDLGGNLDFSLPARRVLLMGAGGAARGVVLPLLEAGLRCLVIANRTPAKADELAREFASHGPVSASGYGELAGQSFDLVVNATSSSLADALPPLPAGVFADGSLAYDMMYGKGLTPFLRFAREHGAARLADGFGMLVEQAAEAFLLWRGVRPDTRPVIAALRPC